METRLTELEIRYMKQEKTLLDLSDVVYRQEVAIERLKREVEQLREQLAALTPGGVSDSGEEPPPPHY
jgi:SlyX protein